MSEDPELTEVSKRTSVHLSLSGSLVVLSQKTQFDFIPPASCLIMCRFSILFNYFSL